MSLKQIAAEMKVVTGRATMAGVRKSVWSLAEPPDLSGVMPPDEPVRPSSYGRG